METVLGCAHKDGAKVLFGSPEVGGKEFREAVDIYACGSGPLFTGIVPGYVSKLREENDGDMHVVLARSFVSGGRCERGPVEEAPEEKFDVVFCVPVDALSDEMVSELSDMLARSPRGGMPGGHGGFGGGRPKGGHAGGSHRH